MKICDFSFLLFLRKNEKTPETLDFTGFSGGVFGLPDRIRTCDHRNRNPVLYPAELRAEIDISVLYHIGRGL